MPILPQEEAVAGYGGVAQPEFAPQPKAKAPSFLEGLAAVFEEGNTVGSTLKFFEYEKLMQRGVVEDGYDPFTDIAGYEDEAGQFATSLNRSDTAVIKRRIDDEKATREQINRAGGWGIAGSILAGVLDPVNLIPAGGTAVKAKTFGQGVKTGLEVGFKSSLMSEGVLQATQVERTPEEVALNITGGTLFGGLIGGTGGAISERIAAKDARLADRLDAEFKAALDDATYVDAGSLSAASVRTGSADQVKPAGSLGIAELEAKNPLSDNPLLRGLTSPSTETNRVISELAEIPYYMKGNAEGVASPVAAESLIKGWQGPLAQSITDMDEQFALYRMGRPKKRGDMLRAGIEDLTGSPKLSYQAFKEEVAKAMRRGDKSPIPEVTEAAKRYRAKIFDPLKNDAADVGIIDPNVDVDTAESYLTRVWDTIKIRERRNEFIDSTLVPWLTQQHEGSAGRYAEIEKLHQELTTRLEAAKPKLEAAKAKMADIKPAAPKAKRAVELSAAEKSAAKAQAKLEGDLAKANERLAGLPEPVTPAPKGDTVQARANARHREAAYNVRRLEEALARQREETGKLGAKREASAMDAEYLSVEGRAAKAMVDDLSRKVGRLEASVKRLSGKMEGERLMSGADASELRGMAEEITATLLGHAPGRTGYDIAANLRGPLKERTLSIPDALAEDWLENDIERVARIYTRTMGADVELARRFGRPDMADQMDAIKASYEKDFRRTPDGPKQKALSDRLDRDLKDIEAVRDRIRGQYAIPTDPNGLGWRMLRTMRTLNYLRLLGGMTVSAIPDLARVVLAGGGLGKTMTRGLIPMVGNLKKFKLAAAEVRMAGTALDMVLDSRAQQMADVFDDFGRSSKLERGLQYAGEKFGLVSLMSPWNAAMKQFAGVMIQGRILRAMTEGGSPAETKRLRFLGLDGDMAARIKREFNKHGEKGGGIWNANTADWTDIEASKAFRAALVKEVDGHIISPGQEKPLWMSTELGKTVGQFKSFTFSAMSRQLIRGLQERDAAVAQSVVLGVSLGMLSYYLKALAATPPGQEPKVSSDPKKWVMEGLDRSGALGWVMEANNMVEKVSRNRIGVNPALGIDPNSRYVTRSPAEAVLGPSVGLANDTWQTVGALSGSMVPDEEGNLKPMSRSDIERAGRLVPFQNVFYLNWLFNGVEDRAGDALGLPEKPEK